MDNINWYLKYESFLKNNLHWIEEGNEKLAKTVTTALNVRS